ncbi:MAG: acyl carrier protein [Lachnospiraceae bacterium]|nr:acyl carrier protein [Lachnospiraceae bacterium]
MINSEIRAMIEENLEDELVSSLDEIDDDEELLIVGIDSINLVSLILLIEDKYDISFDIEDIDMENFNTISKISQKVETMING